MLVNEPLEVYQCPRRWTLSPHVGMLQGMDHGLSIMLGVKALGQVSPKAWNNSRARCSWVRDPIPLVAQ